MGSTIYSSTFSIKEYELLVYRNNVLYKRYIEKLYALKYTQKGDYDIFLEKIKTSPYFIFIWSRELYDDYKSIISSRNLYFSSLISI